ncbi:hypothetical protein TNCV_1105821 [Trichonephila clavipes]|nr:hypothetical protein TNCV_1105821 [Trichonephila clavipes]
MECRIRCRPRQLTEVQNYMVRHKQPSCCLRVRRKSNQKPDSLAGRRAVLLARWIVRSVPLEIVGSSGHEKVPTRGKPGLERPARPRGERIEGSCGKYLWSPQ